MADLGGDLVTIARQALEAAHRDVVQREDLERIMVRLAHASVSNSCMKSTSAFTPSIGIAL